MGEREDIQISLLFFQNFSGPGSMSNMARTGFDKVGEEIGQRSAIPDCV